MRTLHLFERFVYPLADQSHRFFTSSNPHQKHWAKQLTETPKIRHGYFRH